MVDSLEAWRWSSYPMVAGILPAAPWLDTDWLMSQFGQMRDDARTAYRAFILAGKGLSSPLNETRHQLLLGTDEFAHQIARQKELPELRELSKAQRKNLAPALEHFQTTSINRNQAMARAYLSGAYTMSEIAQYFQVHYMTVSRAVRAFEIE